MFRLALIFALAHLSQPRASPPSPGRRAPRLARAVAPAPASDRITAAIIVKELKALGYPSTSTPTTAATRAST